MTHTEIEILHLVSKLSKAYIKVRQSKLIEDYTPYLVTPYMLEAFQVMIGIKN